MSMPSGYRITLIEGRQSITVLHNGDLKVMSDNDPSFNKVVEYISYNEYDKAVALFDKETGIKNALADSVLSDRVKIEQGDVILDGERCVNEITDLIIDMYEQGEDYVPLANFFALLSENKVHHTRHRLFDWLRSAGKFSLDGDGYIIGYKGLRNDFTSSHSGPGVVNGVAVTGHLDNSPGNFLEIEKVEMNPEVGCAHGLHVGTFEYASDWARGGKLVSVRVSPADVGSVPTDCSDQKMRVFKYEVIEEVSSPYSERIVK